MTASLIARILPGQSNQFVIEVIPAEQGHDVFELAGENGKIILRGNSANSLAVALNWYLKYFCLTSVSWYVDVPIELPRHLPPVNQTIRKVNSQKNRFFFNYCTFGYTMAFWQWHDWERLIDWMALNGINMPLAITGTEYIWQEVWRQHGFSDEEIRSFFTSPAHLPWYHMSMISRWGGPLPQSYIDHGFALQKKILARERELGMTPVLPAFSGHVPKELKNKYPEINISILGTGWHMFPEENYTYFLDPYDSLFPQIQRQFLEALINHYGTDHIYGSDPFNEVTPPSWEPAYLAKTGQTIYHTMSAVDPEAIWLQMGWLFHYDAIHWTQERVKALLTSVPRGKMIILDYFCENTEVWRKMESFFGVPSIWCYLGNFGGQTAMSGPIQRIDSLLTKAFAENENMCGIGSTLEGLDVNPVVYEFLMEKAWHDKKIDLGSWFQDYARRRSGSHDPAIETAWLLLREKVYGSDDGGGGAVFHSRPRLSGKHGFVYPSRNYQQQKYYDIWASLMKAAAPSQARDSYQFDLVNVIRQYLAELSLRLRDEMDYAFHAQNQTVFQQVAAEFLALIADQDLILATRPEFLFGQWINDARALAANETEARLYEKSARNLVTTWGPPYIRLTEYSSRDWAGLTNSYYLKRWEKFIEILNHNLTTKTNFNSEAFEQNMLDWEWTWINSTASFSNEPTGSTLTIAQKLFEKYSSPEFMERRHPVSQKIGEWNEEKVSDQFAAVEWDVTEFVQQPGNYLVKFQYYLDSKSKHDLLLKSVALVQEDQIIAEDIHAGMTGRDNRNNDNIYSLSVGEVRQGAKYTLRAIARMDGGICRGFIQMYQLK
ncbi:MAG: alpha-N-acetylglucosaminidase [Candidatus Zhuqueibacterota bacterium]